MSKKKKSRQRVEQTDPTNGHDTSPPARSRLGGKEYRRELHKLQLNLVKMQEFIVQQQLKVIVLFEGRDAAGKGGTIKRITETLNPRVCRVVALGKPTERERSQWYFQRYITELPAAGELVLFDRSWYNRAGVERVMGFASEAEVNEFLMAVPDVERLLVEAGFLLVKYWFSVSDAEQERRFKERIKNPTKRWKLSPMDLESRARWFDYARAKDEMFDRTDTKHAPWWVVEADDKKRARLNCIRHLLNQIPCPYDEFEPTALKLPKRQKPIGYVRPPVYTQRFIPEVY